MTEKKENTKSQVNTNTIDGANELLEKSHAIFFAAVKPLISGYFDSIDNVLMRICKQSDTDKKKKNYQDALKSIRVYKLNVLSSFLKSLKQTFKLFKKQDFNYFEDKVTKVVKKNSLSNAVEKDDVIEKMAQNALIHESEKKHQQSLDVIQEHFAGILSKKVDLYHVPVSPYVLVSSFAKSIRLLHLEVQIKLILYKHFERNIMNNLNNVYDDINRYLADNIEQSQKKHKDTKNTNRRAHDQSFIINILITLQQQALMEFSHSSLWPYTPNKTVKLLLERIVQSQRPIDKQSLETFNLIGMLFQSIIDNRDIPQTVTFNLIKLQIAYTKAAILDDTLVKDKSHPAQSLLDSMSLKSIGWSADSDTDNLFINKIKNIVDNILHENNLDQVFFKDLLDDFTTFVDGHNNSFKDEQLKVKDKVMGREKIVTAMKSVEALLAHKIEDVQMPNEIKNILLGPWKNVLALLLVRESSTSIKYLQMVNFIDDVIKILTPKKFEMVMQQNIAKLCNTYEKGLELVAYSGVELKKKTEELYLCLLKVHNLKDRRQDMDYINEQSSQGPIKSTERLYEAVKHIDYSNNTPDLSDLNVRDQNTLSKIKVGMWLSFTDENEEAFEAKLSWISPRSGKYLFVNSKGLKTLDRTPQQLATGLNRKEISIVKKS